MTTKKATKFAGRQARAIKLKSKSKEDKKPRKICGSCFLFVGKGKRHKCLPGTRVMNLKNIVTSLPENDEVVHALIKEKLEASATSTPYREFKLRGIRGGNQMRVLINQSERKLRSSSTVFSANDMVNMKSDLGISQKKTIRLASMIRTRLQDRKAVESNLKQKLFIHSHNLDKFFVHKTVDFTVVKGKTVSNVTCSVVFCKDLNGLIEHVKNERKTFQVHLKFGIDGGGGSLKFCLLIQSTEHDPTSETKRQKYKDGIAAKTFLDTGVKKLLIIGLGEDVQENYENVHKLWSFIDINSVLAQGTISVDLKLANIISGLMAHSSLHPCTWCVVKKDQLENDAELRTIGVIIDNYLLWQENGEKLSEGKKYFNCIHKPIYTGDIDEMILDIIPPPELHLLIGLVNHMYDHLLKESSDAALLWAKLCHVEKEITNGGSSFNGNACKKLLNNIDILRSNCPIASLKFVKAFDHFQLVVQSCFGKNLDFEFKRHINDFKRSYLDLQIPVTPKAHCVFYHVIQFCERNNKALAFYGEQAVEAVHFQFKSIWRKHKVNDKHPKYAQYLFNAVCDFNSQNV